MFWKKTNGIGNRRFVALDDCTSTYNDFDIDIKTAIDNYEKYQNDLKLKQQDLIKKWCKEIREASSRGKKFILTNRFITDGDKDKILFLVDDAGCTCECPSGSTLEYFRQYFEDRGFKVVRIEFPMNNMCYLKIIWISSDNV